MNLAQFFGFSKPKQPITQPVKGYQAFSTPFMTVGGGNLSLPQVNKYYTQNNIVRFGVDNLYPQLLNQMVFTSALHGSIIKFITNAVIGGGYSWNDKKLNSNDQINLISFEKRNKLSKLAASLTRDYIIHCRVCVKIVKKKGQIVKFYRLDPSTIRNSIDLQTFVYCSDWSRGTVDLKMFKRYDEDNELEESIYIYQEESPGQDVYPIPFYNSVLNWCFLDGEQSFFHKSNIQNSIFPSLVIRTPKKLETPEQIAAFKQQILSTTGAGNAGTVLVLGGNGSEDIPTFDQVSANNNDKLFEQTAKECKEQICFAHSINPSLVGIKVAGSLGNSSELKESYAIFEKNVIMPLRTVMEEIFNDLVDIADIKNTLVINNFQIIDTEIVQK